MKMVLLKVSDTLMNPINVNINSENAKNNDLSISSLKKNRKKE
jgi:hypothetical protein